MFNYFNDYIIYITTYVLCIPRTYINSTYLNK